MREYSFNLEAARKYGVDGAILLQGLAFWITKNRANARHFRDGRWWTYNSQEALAKLFPFWTRRQIQRIVKNLNEEGAVLTANFSQGAQHNVTWFALSDEVLRLLGAEECASEESGELRVESGECPEKSTAPNGAVAESTAPNGAVYRTEPCGHNRKQLDTTVTPYNPPTGESARVPDGELASAEGGASQDDENFATFWRAYPRKIDKDRARRAWKKLKADMKLAAEIMAGLRAWKACEQWEDPRFIPHPATWLNNRRWETPPPAGRGRRAPEAEPPDRPVEEWT